MKNPDELNASPIESAGFSQPPPPDPHVQSQRRDISTYSELADCQSFIDLIDSAWGPNGEVDGIRRIGGAERSLFGRFNIQRKLGEGGFGVVFLAEDTTLARTIALKLPRPEILFSPALRSRFVREGQAAASLSHYNIVAVFEAGEVGSIAYIASEYCDGPTLAEWCHGQPDPVDPRRAAKIVARLADAVHHAHQRGILHRDIKPSNVIMQRAEVSTLVYDFVPKLTDFGLAKQLNDRSNETVTGVRAGTMRYMAPEQLTGRGREVGVFTDIYALGVLLYELLNNRVPFDGDDELSIIRQIREDEPRGLRTVRPNLPRDLESICLKCLEKPPDRRYASAQSLAEDLQRYLNGSEVKARPLRLATRLWRRCRRRPLVATLLGLLALTVVAGASGMLWQWRTTREHAAQVERDLIEAEAGLVNWAWVLEESRDLPYSNDLTNETTRDHLRQHYAALLQRPLLGVGSAPFRATQESFAARMAMLSDNLPATEEHLDRGLEQWRELVRKSPDNHMFHRGLASTLYLQSVLLRKTQHFSEPLANLEHATVVFEHLLAEEPNRGGVCHEFASLLQQRGDALYHLNIMRDSRAAYTVAAKLWEHLSVHFPKQPSYRLCQADALYRWSNRSRVLSDLDGSILLSEQAAGLVQGLIASDPDNHEYQILQVQIERFLAAGARKKLQMEAAIKYYEAARERLALIITTPNATTFSRNLFVSTTRNLAQLYDSSKRFDQAVQMYDASISNSIPLALAREISAENVGELAHTCKSLGDLHFNAGRPTDALRAWEHACHAFRNPLARGYDQRKHFQAWARCSEQIAKVHESDQRFADALVMYRESQGILEGHADVLSDAEHQQQLVRIKAAMSRVSNPTSN